MLLNKIDQSSQVELEQQVSYWKETLPNAEIHTVVSLDLTDLSKVDDVVSSVIDQVGRVDVLVNNGGISQRSLVGETPIEVDRKIMEVNFFGAVGLTKALLPALRETNGQIIVISSISGKFGFFLRSAYAASKHAVVGVVRASAIELNKYGITVNALCPGYVDTPMLDKGLDVTAARTGKTRDELRAALALKQPGGRLLTSDEVASAAIDFISNGETGQARWLDATTIGEKK